MSRRARSFCCPEPETAPAALFEGSVHRVDLEASELLRLLAPHQRGLPSVGVHVGLPGETVVSTAKVCAVNLPAGWPTGTAPQSAARRWLEI